MVIYKIGGVVARVCSIRLHLFAVDSGGFYNTLAVIASFLLQYPSKDAVLGGLKEESVDYHRK